MGLSNDPVSDFEQRRRSLLRVTLAMAVASFVGACAHPRPTAVTRATIPRILFVCQFGTVKSPIARELTRRRAGERGMTVAAQSRGITPGGQPSAALAAMLKAERLDPRADPLRQLTQDDIDRADLVILFDTLPVGLDVKNGRNWSDLGSMNADYPAARADVLQRIEGLLDELARGGVSPHAGSGANTRRR